MSLSPDPVEVIASGFVTLWVCLGMYREYRAQIRAVQCLAEVL